MPPHRGVSGLYTMVSFWGLVGEDVCGFRCASLRFGGEGLCYSRLGKKVMYSSKSSYCAYFS